MKRIRHGTSPESLRLHFTAVCQDTCSPAYLAAAIDDARDCVEALQAFISDATTHVANLVPPGETVESDDGRRWKVRRKKGSTQWDTDGLAPVVMARARDERRVIEETGEYESEGEAVMRVTLRCAGVGYWRKGELRKLGIDPDEYLASSPGRLSVEREDDVTPEPYQSNGTSMETT